ncbi:MAG: hypothetical protein A3H88_00050 [Candidatus Blackburnbacteria bacterium RIFCSPLOWO2_02_FULL_44_9]|uniref:Uncharacterized protein n=1 Tax=Candidatus Blackburnbacteria bacterium RIFCSPHIGHO2_02_FULL_44_20 TaxID=1797516 RepID=A0A1G1V733_9BACT|nr:MAG: hypothetical protein A3E16_03585 [Candidatus Blackburnbacteria bacterium RIFCSPHIGHO2_12_FULL_44_25]OGY11220.1 MAG: hypothetical protein A3D26_04240 [Candidatus Blackburnbacteria bacterium RIFCSPHIGHO2_02_FULL_44_20]OGY14432.1 MAG: hypothetical protein A3A62_00510 [Candidatus Blackburnbacteria bacterium RIFCSPLOWO2_01_FULL_44_43]OGY17048.1 MAG: hypothetical protein A3H88_00050 [Candidatus Blackburnbacteria bacterium RIFCSPLOWO2_02_FULL_44_9]
MEDKQRKLNKPLILLSLAGTALLSLAGNSDLFPTHPIKSISEFIGTYALILVLMPIINLWVRALWNNIIPAVFHTREISYWESLGLLVLLALLLI